MSKCIFCMRRNQSIWQWLALKLGKKIHHPSTLKRKQNTDPDPVDHLLFTGNICRAVSLPLTLKCDFSEILPLLSIHHSSLVAENRHFNK